MISASPGQTEPAPQLLRGPEVGLPAPLFDLPATNFTGVDFLTLDDLVGKPSVLVFFTTWCPYCLRQTPVLLTAYSKYGTQIQMVGINVEEPQAQVDDYINKMNIPYPVLLDINRAVADAYQISGFPTTYFLDDQGVIIARHVGQLDDEKLDQYLKRLIP